MQTHVKIWWIMETKLLRVKPDSPDLDKVKVAAEIIKKGGLVAFPTETVYGLGAAALNPLAVSKIFEVKKRPLNDPLIVHISKKCELFKLAEEIPDKAIKLIDSFWPGPLTLILKKTDLVPEVVTAGLDTVAIRMPANPIALFLITEAQAPIAAPSANLFGRPSPTTAKHVLDDLAGKVDMVIDGGKTNFGVESTVVDLSFEPPCVLRPGAVTVEKLKEVLGQIQIYQNQHGIVRSPGTMPRHYSPKAKLLVIEGKRRAKIKQLRRLAFQFKSKGRRVGIIATEENKDFYREFETKILGSSTDLRSCACNLFSILRSFDEEGIEVIIAEGVKNRGLGLTIMDRLRKAAGPRK